MTSNNQQVLYIVPAKQEKPPQRVSPENARKREEECT